MEPCAYKFCMTLILLATIWVSLLYMYYSLELQRNYTPISRPTGPACPKPKLQNDVLVVLRVDAADVLKTLPVHFETVLNCVPDYVIYSDIEGEADGQFIYNTLDESNNSIKSNSPNLRPHSQSQRTSERQKHQNTPEKELRRRKSPQPETKGSLSMIDRALRHRPDAKWFVFLEADTYMLWQNMLEYLAKFNTSHPYYLGKHIHLDDILLAHGGPGFVLSNPASKRVVKYWREHQEEWQQYTKVQVASDVMLGKALEEVDVNLVWPSPFLHENSLATFNWKGLTDAQPWCFKPVAFHHMTKAEFNMMWHFEEERRRRKPNGNGPSSRDIFKRLVYPQLQPKCIDWDNLSAGAEYSNETLALLSPEDRVRLPPVYQEASFSFERCRAACESKSTCIQFSYTIGKCTTSDELRLGYAIDVHSSHTGIEDVTDLKGESSIQSGWIMSRVSSHVQELDRLCNILEDSYFKI
ncbi:hypothetical protein F5Y04DRAFT_290925 [Hypomontagnella monticulosa]|nr:hypothetical protein F5Y04DRAFT_290925 [Hypomontagnella monticulosa]